MQNKFKIELLKEHFGKWNEVGRFKNGFWDLNRRCELCLKPKGNSNKEYFVAL